MQNSKWLEGSGRGSDMERRKYINGTARSQLLLYYRGKATKVRHRDRMKQGGLHQAFEFATRRGFKLASGQSSDGKS